MRNDFMLLVSGYSGSGKSTSLMNMEDPKGVLYLNCEAGKRLPFKSAFDERVITDPKHVYDAFKWAEKQDHIHTIVVDSISFLMEMFESVYIINSKDSRKEWGNYAQYLKNLMQQYVAKSSKNVIFTGHLTEVYDEAAMQTEVKVPVKGAMKNVGVESFFSTVISTKKIPLKELKNYENDLLEITEDDEVLGFKYVFQTRLTKETVGERIRSPMGMWKKEELYIDNDLQKVLGRLKEYYSA